MLGNDRHLVLPCLYLFNSPWMDSQREQSLIFVIICKSLEYNAKLVKGDTEQLLERQSW